MYTTAALALLLAAASFYISYNALQAEAAAMLKTNVIGSHVYPLVVDGATVAFSLWALWAKVNEQPEWRGKTLALLFTCVSIVANIKHAGILSLNAALSERLLYSILAGLPPLGVFLSLEALLHQVGFYTRQTVKQRTTTAVSRQVAATLPKPKEAPKKRIASGGRDDRHQMLLEHLKANSGASYRQLREVAGVSLSTVKKDIDHLTERGIIRRNGNGLEVIG